jgi:vacuolar-type H+-ATPase subunit H
MEDGMDKKITVGTAAGSRDAESAYTNDVASEESLLGVRIEAARQQYITDIENARKEAESRLARERSLVQSEADSVWREAMDRINSDVERVLGESQQQVRLDREREEQRFNGVVDRVVQEISKG